MEDPRRILVLASTPGAVSSIVTFYWATGRLLGQGGIFDQKLIKKIDSSTSVAMRDKVVEAYDTRDQRIYWYSDKPDDSIIGGYLFSISLLHPLRRIADEVNEISARNLTRRVR